MTQIVFLCFTMFMFDEVHVVLTFFFRENFTNERRKTIFSLQEKFNHVFIWGSNYYYHALNTIVMHLFGALSTNRTSLFWALETQTNRS